MKSKFLFPNRYKKIGWALAIPCLVLGLFCQYGCFEFSFLEVSLPFKYPFTDTFDFSNVSSNNDSYTLSGFKEVHTHFNFTDELATIGLIIGLLFVAFAKEKLEDEYVQKVRLESLQWAIYFNFGFLILATIFVHGGFYFDITIYNMFTPLLIFIIRFYYILHLKPVFEAKNTERGTVA